MKQQNIKLLLVLLLSMTNMVAFADEVNGINYSFSGTEATVISGSSKYSGNVVIPESVTYNGNTYSVTSIGERAFYGCSDLTSITIPNSVTSIGNSAFDGCSSLTSVTIPNSVTSIESSAFYNCSGLTSVSIPNSVTSIGKFAFDGCRGLTSVTIPNSVTSIGDWAFSGCSGLTNVTIPNSVTSIGREAFYGCSGLTSVTIPNSMTDIGWGAFSGCSGLTSVTIPNSVTSIGDYAFAGCSGLTSVTIPNSVTSIGEAAFHDCKKLSSVVLPNELKLIKAYAFNDCTSLSSITIPEKVEVIYQSAFSGCGLKEVKVLATKPPFAYDNTFSNYNIPLYVPEASVSDYQSANPWSKFSSFKTLSGGDVEVKKCATPVISYDNGRIVFSCATEGVEYSSSITDADIKNYTTSSIQLGATYTIRVIATKSGYQNSDEATATFSWNGISPIMTGETAKYRLSFVVDNKELKVQNVAYGSQITAPSTDGEGNTVTWYTYPATMPAHDLVVYGMVVKQPELEVLVWLTVKDGQGTTKMKVRKGTEQVLTITPEEGWKVVSVTWNGTDVTAQVKDGSSYTTPAITNDATLIVVYEQDAPSDVASARAGQATVKVVDDGVVIAHAEPQSRCVVYTSNGLQVVSTVIEGDNQKIRLQKGQVYILTINGRTLKFAL